SPEEQLNYVKRHLEVVGFLPPQTDIKLVRGLLQVFQTQCQIHYLPQNTYPTSITLFRASEENSLEESFDSVLQDETLGWNQFSNASVEIYTVPGNHISMMAEPNVKVLAQKLQKCIEKKQPHTNS
ncbi:MAG: thioesterase domain-containing protein, partial [Nostoc sp.]